MGVCHSDLSATNGTIALPPPLVLGHAAAGEVIEVGEGVTSLAIRDHVVSSFIYMCGKCRFCASGRPVLCLEQGKALTTPPEGTPRTRDANGNPLGIFSRCGVMAEYAILSADNLVKIDPTIPLDRAALVGSHHEDTKENLRIASDLDSPCLPHESTPDTAVTADKSVLFLAFLRVFVPSW